jgi:RHS repeat-associated protein
VVVPTRLGQPPKNQTIHYVYDALYRLSSKTYPDSTAVEYAYDLAGKVQQVSDPTGTYGFSYDNMGRLIGTGTQYSYLPGFNFQNAYTYDAASNRASLTAPDGSITTYGYDTLNRLNGMANSWAGSFGFSYDALSRRTQLTRPNGINTNYGYDSVSHLLSVLHQVGTTTLDGASYTYDPAGNRTSKGNYLNGVTSNYGYDPLYELSQVTQGGSTTESYSYDPVGNRLSSVGVPLYNYNPSNQLTSNTTGSYTYDNNGSTLTDASGKSYTWDFENRMVQAVVPGTGGGTTTFKYDPFGRRIQKSGPLGATNYLYDGANSIEEVDNSSNILARYAKGLTIDQPLAESRGSTTDYYEVDALGSVTSLSNGAGSIANTYTYDSLGNVTNSTGSLSNPFRYTGREFDSETSLYFNRARYYDQNAGRFISEDPSEFGGGQNFYSYVGNNPTNLTDPFGLTDCVVTATAVVCTNRGPGLNWMTPQEPQAPQLPSDLAPDPPPPPPAPPCECDMVERGREIDEIVIKHAKHEIFVWVPIFKTAEEASGFFGWQFGKRWIPVVEWVKVAVEVDDTWEEEKKVIEKYKHCGW